MGSSAMTVCSLLPFFLPTSFFGLVFHMRPCRERQWATPLVTLSLRWMTTNLSQTETVDTWFNSQRPIENARKNYLWLSQLFYTMNSKQPKSPFSSPAWQWAGWQDLPSSRSTSHGHACTEIPYILTSRHHANKDSQQVTDCLSFVSFAKIVVHIDRLCTYGPLYTNHWPTFGLGADPTTTGLLTSAAQEV